MNREMIERWRAAALNDDTRLTRALRELHAPGKITHIELGRPCTDHARSASDIDSVIECTTCEKREVTTCPSCRQPYPCQTIKLLDSFRDDATRP